MRYLALAAELSVDPGDVDEDALATADRFCSWACLRYNETDAPPRRQAAADLLAADPSIVARSVFAAAVSVEVKLRIGVSLEFAKPGG